jgi:LysM repeat protein
MNNLNTIESPRTSSSSNPSESKPFSKNGALKRRVVSVLVGAGVFLAPMVACTTSAEEANKSVWPDRQSEQLYDDVIEQQNFSQAQAADYAARQANEPEVAFTAPDNQYAPPEYPKCELYVVKDGDSLSSIAFSLGFTDPYYNQIAAAALQSTNHLSSDKIYQGQTLNVFRSMTGSRSGCDPQ